MNKTQEVIQELKKRGITKWKMAKACGVSWQTIHNWERGMFQPKKEKADILTKMLSAK